MRLGSPAPAWRRWRVAGAAPAARAVVGATTFAQDPAPGGRGGRGAAPPNPLGQPLLDPAGHPRDDVMLHAPLPAGEAKYGDLDGRHMKDVLHDFVAISRKNRESGEAFWGRNVGTAGHADAQNWVDAYFRKVGLQKIHRE